LQLPTALLHNSQAVDNKNEFLWGFYNNFRLSQGQLKTYATTPLPTSIQVFYLLPNAIAPYHPTNFREGSGSRRWAACLRAVKPFLKADFNERMNFAREPFFLAGVAVECPQ
jgi:hypothetical protein